MSAPSPVTSMQTSQREFAATKVQKIFELCKPLHQKSAPKSTFFLNWHVRLFNSLTAMTPTRNWWNDHPRLSCGGYASL